MIMLKQLIFIRFFFNKNYLSIYFITNRFEEKYITDTCYFKKKLIAYFYCKRGGGMMELYY